MSNLEEHIKRARGAGAYDELTSSAEVLLGRLQSEVRGTSQCWVLWCELDESRRAIRACDLWILKAPMM
jgi:hypothetical protein